MASTSPSPPAPTYVREVELLTPNDGARVSGVRSYCWQPNGNLPPGGAFQVAIWKSDHDWDKEASAQSIQTPTNVQTDGRWCIDVNVSQLIDEHKFVKIQKNEEVRWGVFVVDENGATRYLGTHRNIIFE